MKRFYVMDFGEDLVIHYDTQDEEKIALHIDDVAKLLNEQQYEIERLKEQLLGISLDVIAKANPFLSKLNEYVRGLSEEERQ